MLRRVVEVGKGKSGDTNGTEKEKDVKMNDMSQDSENDEVIANMPDAEKDNL